MNVNKLTNQLVENNIISEDDKEIYAYGLSIAGHNLLILAIMAVIALLLKSLDIMLIFCLSYIPLRKFAGGFHQSTRFRCLLTSELTFLAVALLVMLADKLTAAYISMPLLLLFSTVVIFIKAPIDSVNRRINAAQTAKYRKKSIIILCILLFVTGILSFFGLVRYAFALTLSITVEGVLLLIPERIHKGD